MVCRSGVWRANQQYFCLRVPRANIRVPVTGRYTVPYFCCRDGVHFILPPLMDEPVTDFQQLHADLLRLQFPPSFSSHESSRSSASSFSPPCRLVTRQGPCCISRFLPMRRRRCSRTSTSSGTRMLSMVRGVEELADGEPESCQYKDRC